jgi:hypothetical protein
MLNTIYKAHPANSYVKSAIILTLLILILSFTVEGVIGINTTAILQEDFIVNDESI